MSDCDPMDCSPPGSSVYGDSPDKDTGVGCHALLQGNLPNPGTEPMSSASPAMQADSLWLSHWGSPIKFTIHNVLLFCGPSIRSSQLSSWPVDICSPLTPTHRTSSLMYGRSTCAYCGSSPEQELKQWNQSVSI